MQSERTTFEALNSALRFAASRSAITSAEELAIMASSALARASSARASASLILKSASALVKAAILSLVTVSAAPAATATTPDIIVTQNATEAIVSRAAIDPHILPPPNLELIFGMGAFCIIAISVAIQLCLWRYRRWKRVMAENNVDTRFDRLLSAMAHGQAPSAGKKSSVLLR